MTQPGNPYSVAATGVPARTGRPSVRLTGWRYLVVLSGADVGPAAENVLRATGSATLRFVWPVHNKATALNNEFEVGSDPRWAGAGVCES